MKKFYTVQTLYIFLDANYSLIFFLHLNGPLSYGLGSIKEFFGLINDYYCYVNRTRKNLFRSGGIECRLKIVCVD